jgi:RNA polymerase sigma-70 factor (ECF subfamily)
MVMMNATAIQKSLPASDEARLIFDSRQGDPEAFNLLVLHYQDRIYNLAVRILGDEDVAGDVTQNTFMTAYLNLPRFRNGSFRSWLYRIATNACYDIHRFHHRHPVISIDDKDLAEEKLRPLDGFSSSRGLPEKEYERHEVEHIIQQALVKLDIDHRTVVILVDQQELDYKETACILGLPIGTVKSRLARGRQYLRKLLLESLSLIYD